MKNEQAAKSLYGAGTEAEAEAVIAKNLEYVFRAEAYAHERKFAHLKERAERIARALKAQTGSADIMDAVSDSYEAADIFASMRGEKQDFSKFFGKPNTEAAYPLSENSSKLDEFYNAARSKSLRVTVTGILPTNSGIRPNFTISWGTTSLKMPSLFFSDFFLISLENPMD